MFKQYTTTRNTIAALITYAAFLMVYFSGLLYSTATI